MLDDKYLTDLLFSAASPRFLTALMIRETVAPNYSVHTNAISNLGGITATYSPIGHGGGERMIVYPVLIWLIALSGHLMAQSEIWSTQ